MNSLYHPWLVMACGVLFCISGILVFRKNVFEENHSLTWPFLLMVMGIILVATGTAKIVL
ncbi:MAG: hypothetical protein EOO05_07005 [Chitinophagaceae bacterium]|nr:MAG: hypothetical protein EOO05_07005 [Chitinophagaceae bacterium]